VDIFEELKNRLEIKDVVERYTSAKFNSSNQCCCPFHNEKTASFTVYPSTNTFKCFGAKCSVSGDLAAFVAKFKGIGMIEAAQALCQDYGLPFEIPAQNSKKARTQEIKEYVERCKKDISKTDYFERRGLTAEMIKRFNLGYDAQHKAVVIPYNRKLTYYQSRSIHNRKFYKPNSDEEGCEKLKEPLYNEDALSEKSREPVFVTESPICAMSIMQLGGRAVSTCGGSGVNKFAEKLKTLKQQPVFVLTLDNDEGGKAATRELAALFSKEKIKFVVYSVSGDEKDPNDLLQKDPHALKQNMQAARMAYAKKHTRAGDLMSMSELESTKFPPRQWLIKDLMTIGLHIVVAPPKYGKSFLAMDMGLSIARARPFLDFVTERHDVLYLVLEDRFEDFKFRAAKYLRNEPFPSNMFLCDKDEYRLKEIKSEDSLIEYLEEVLYWHPKIKLIIIDTFQHIRGEQTRNEGIYNYDRRETRYLKKFADKHRMAVTIVCHTRKSKDETNEFNEVSGSSGLQGGVDTIFKITKKNVADTDAVFSVLGRGIRVDPFSIHFDSENLRWKKIANEQERAQQRAIEEYRSSSYRKVVLGLLNDNGGSWQGTMSDFVMASARYLLHSLPQVNPTQLSKEFMAIDHYLKDIDGIVHIAPSGGGRIGRLHDFHFTEREFTQQELNTT